MQPNHRTPSNWGLCMDGNHAPFCSALDAALSGAGEVFRYAEIGIGYGATLNAVAEYLSQSGKRFLLSGVDLPEFAGNAANPQNYPPQVTLHLVGSKAFLQSQAGGAFDFIFIDGCHGAACAREDFLGAEPLVRVGGVIAFHDVDPGCQDIHFQPHCQTGIRVRESVEKLGLLDGSRAGWRVLCETSGDKSKGGHGCLFVQKT